MVIGPEGEVVLRLPMAEPGVGIFELGASELEWRSQSEATAGSELDSWPAPASNLE